MCLGLFLRFVFVVNLVVSAHAFNSFEFDIGVVEFDIAVDEFAFDILIFDLIYSKLD